MHWIRTIFLLGALLGLGVWSSLKWRPAWIGIADQWMVDRYLKGSDSLVFAAEEGAPSPGEEREFFKRSVDIQKGDRHFAAWCQTGEALIAAHESTEDWSAGIAVLDELIDRDPRRLSFRLRRARWLSRVGDRAATQLALEEVSEVCRLFPKWQEALELRTVIRAQFDGFAEGNASAE